jgi:transcriptional regulator with XRE-family HTH domain
MHETLRNTGVSREAMNLRLAFATNLRRLRSEGGLSQQKLAIAAGLNRSHLSRLENGMNDPRLAIVSKLADVFGVEPAELLRLRADETGEALSRQSVCNYKGADNLPASRAVKFSRER